MIDFLLTAGGLVWAILGVSTIMWWLIIKAYFNQNISIRLVEQSIISEKKKIQTLPMNLHRKVCTSWISQFEQELNKGIPWISVFVKVLPLLGLLGTVDGMIDSFTELEQLNIQRQLSGGMSQALLTTLSGLLTSLSGLYFAHNLKQRKQRYVVDLRTQLEGVNALSSS